MVTLHGYALPVHAANAFKPPFAREAAPFQRRVLAGDRMPEHDAAPHSSPPPRRVSTAAPQQSTADHSGGDLGRVLSLQAAEMREATAKLRALERDPALAAQLNSYATDDPIVKRVSRTLASNGSSSSNSSSKSETGSVVSSGSDSDDAPPAARVDFEDVLELLLASLEQRFDTRLHRQKCASPVPLTRSGDAFESLFYVAKDRGCAVPQQQQQQHPQTRADEAAALAEGVPVRYQGFTKGTVWWSESAARRGWGIVARRMQHQARVKQSNSKAEAAALASRAALFFHVFEGFSYVLVRRPGGAAPPRKSDLGALVVEEAAKIVQLWPLRGGATSLRRMHSPEWPAVNSAASTDDEEFVLPTVQQQKQQQRKRGAQGAARRSSERKRRRSSVLTGYSDGESVEEEFDDAEDDDEDYHEHVTTRGVKPGQQRQQQQQQHVGMTSDQLVLPESPLLASGQANGAPPIPGDALFEADGGLLELSALFAGDMMEEEEGGQEDLSALASIFF